jgi:hypothetical protein
MMNEINAPSGRIFDPRPPQMDAIPLGPNASFGFDVQYGTWEMPPTMEYCSPDGDNPTSPNVAWGSHAKLVTHEGHACAQCSSSDPTPGKVGA